MLHPHRPVVLLLLDDPSLCATCAYGLSAAGFDVATPDRVRGRDAAISPPDIVVIALPDDRGEIEAVTHALARDLKTGSVPIVAIAPDMSATSLSRARVGGCAAICLATCAPDTLASGLRAVLERSERESSRQTGRRPDMDTNENGHDRSWP